MGQIQTILALLLVSLFALAIIGFAISFGNSNDAAVKITDDSEISDLYTTTSSSASDFKDDSESQYASIVETTLEPGAQTAQSVGPFAVTPANVIGVFKNTLQVAYQKIFGTGSGFGIFLTALLAMVVFVLGLYLYKTLRGQPD